MNPKLDVIFARRSVRAYGDGAVDSSAVKDLLEAAMAAPSAKCQDPWHFVVIRDREVLAKLADGLPNGRFLVDARVGIVVCGELEKAHRGEQSFMMQDCSAAIQNILLAASALGLGACWLGVHPRTERMEHLRNVLGIPESITPLSVVSVGVPADRPTPRTRYSDSAVHMEKW